MILKLDETEMEIKQDKILILGLGNVLLQDEGVGVHVLHEMLNLKWAENIDLLDGGTSGFVLLSLFNEYQKIIIIDAALTNDPPGTINVLEPKFAKDFPRSLSTHDLGLKDLIESAYLIGKNPQLYLIAVSVDPKQEMSTDLTIQTKMLIPTIIIQVQKLIKNINLN